jgi:hypothetical protein
MSRRLGEDVIVASEYARILFKNQEGLETVAYELSRARLGKISRVFRSVIRKEKNGIPVRKSLEKLSHSDHHPYIKRFASHMAAETHIEVNLAQLSDSVMVDENLSIERLTRRLELVSNAMLLLPHVPILLPLIDLVNNSLTQMPEESGLAFDTLIPEGAKLVLLLGVAAALILLMILLRIRK